MTLRKTERREIHSATHRGLEAREALGTAKCLRLAVLILFRIGIPRPEHKPEAVQPNGQVTGALAQ